MRLCHQVATRAVTNRRLAAPRERVFQAWTEAAHLQRWFFPMERLIQPVEVDLTYPLILVRGDPCRQ